MGEVVKVLPVHAVQVRSEDAVPAAATFLPAAHVVHDVQDACPGCVVNPLTVAHDAQMRLFVAEGGVVWYSPVAQTVCPVHEAALGDVEKVFAPHGAHARLVVGVGRADTDCPGVHTAKDAQLGGETIRYSVDEHDVIVPATVTGRYGVGRA